VIAKKADPSLFRVRRGEGLGPKISACERRFAECIGHKGRISVSCEGNQATRGVNPPLAKIKHSVF